MVGIYKDIVQCAMKWKTFFLIILDFHQFVSDDNGYPTLCGSRSQITSAKNTDGQVITTSLQVYARSFLLPDGTEGRPLHQCQCVHSLQFVAFCKTADLSCNMGKAAYRSTHVFALRPFIC
jgi:hypothetical protein